jgi:eukaryotic-like serine/threonine-protein kinase
VEAGTRLGPYETVSRLGAGGMGEVWKAKDTRLGRSVAIKVLKGSNDPEARRRLVREAQIASKLTHPNIATLHDVGAEGDVDFLVMELLEGETLLERLGKGPLPAPEALRVGREIAAALAHAHGLGFVHRDLKPSNVFLTASGTKLLDFGLARTAPSAAGVDASGLETASALTTPGTVLGTVGYMSPEQVRGAPADSRSDVFSFGAVLYEMLSGRRAFPGDTAVESLHAILKAEPPPLDTKGGPAGAAPLLARCLAKNPVERFPSGVELATALRSVPDDATGTPAGRSPARRLPVGRSGKIAITAAGLALAVVVGLVYRRAGVRQRLDSLAILPFANATGDPALAYLSDGLAESLIQTLARAPNLRVMAMSSVARFRGAADPLAVGKELGVGGVLTGSVRSLGDTLSVSAALVDAADGRQLWGETFERTGGRIPALQSEIAGEIVRALRLRLSGEDYRKLAKAPTGDREAYLLWLQGRYRLEKRTDAEIQKALELFRRALDRDPTYAQAWAGTAAAWNILAYTGLRDPDEAFPRSQDAARKALELDPSNADALAVLAHVTLLYENNAEESEKIFRKALAIDPNAVDARHWYAHLLSRTGRLAEAAQEGKRLLELEPLSLVANLHKAEELNAEGRLDDAAAQLRKTIDLDPGFYPAWMTLGKIETERGRSREAVAALREASRLEPSSPRLKKWLAEAEAAAAQSPR